jgi:hypothetical protein
MGVITLDSIKNQKQVKFLQKVSDIFDENRGNIPDDLAFTRFSGMNHTVLFNTATPELNGKSLIQFDNDKVLFAPTQIQSLICNEPSNNPTINILTILDNNHVWEAKSDDKILKLLINFRDKTPIEGFSIRFADSVRTKYKMTLMLANEDNEVLSQVVSGMESSWDTNNQQFFQLGSKVEGVTKAVVDLELVGTNDYVWKVNNLTFYNNMNIESLKSLSKLGVITWSLVQNSVFTKDLEQQGDKTSDLLKMDNEQPVSHGSNIFQAPSQYIDHYGSPLPYAPLTNRQYFDNLSQNEIVKISSLPRLYTVTDLPTGDKIYTFETNSDELQLKFFPLEEMNKYSDEPVIQLDKIVKSGEIKKGGFKNYVLTFYIRMDGITMTDEKLTWKYGGYYFDRTRPELARAMNVTIPINNKSGITPHVYTEYVYEKLKDMSDKLHVLGDFKGIEDGHWIGLQFIRQVDTDNDTAVQKVRINKNPFDADNQTINPNGFEDYLVYNDTSSEDNNDHIAAIWSGVIETVSVKGSKFVSLYGVSLYETEFNTIEEQ